MGLTPMMKQYMLIKEEYADAILFFRLGDFYEMFFEDAIIASKELDIVLTGRDCGLEERAPMCGVPYHSVDGYIKRLIERGYKVAICEQLTDPASGKGIVERGVTRVITPGTIIEESMIKSERNNYILSLYISGDDVGFAWCDVSTGEFNMQEQSIKEHRSKLYASIAKISPAEIIANQDTLGLIKENGQDFNTTCFDEWSFRRDNAIEILKKHFNVSTLEGFGANEQGPAVIAAGALLEYLNQTQKVKLSHINTIKIIGENEFMELDQSTRRNLELTTPIMGGSKKGTLLWVLDKTKTSQGARLLRRFLEQPLQDINIINQRLDSVSEVFENYQLRESLRETLSGIYDIERLCSKISYGTVNARDAISLKDSLKKLPELKKLLMGCSSVLLKQAGEKFDTLEELSELIDKAIVDDPPLSLKEGGIIKKGYNSEVDKLRQAHIEGKNWLGQLEAKEKEATGIKNLKIGFNKVFGYYIEVTKSQYSLVPYRYIRKQTLVNCERFITEELKQIEETVLGAEEKCIKFEYLLFLEIRDEMERQLVKLQTASNCISLADALQSLATAAFENNYIRPLMNNENIINIQDGRHPVVEQTVKGFVPNSALLDCSENRLLIVTGPNMSGKSTYMRQVAVLTLMAHIGSFVPVKSADICVVDRIFTRVGASDDLASGRSTFMVEMIETANILNNATEKSLIILDEIGRGTSTFDGLSIAWSVAEYISGKIRAKTLFATHYHELCEMEDNFEGVKNYCILAKEKTDEILFLHRIVRGGTDKSFGIQVAKLAGVPSSVVERAKVILDNLRKLDVDTHILKSEKSKVKAQQISLLGANDYRREEIIDTLRTVDVSNMTPLEALNLLNLLNDKAVKL